MGISYQAGATDEVVGASRARQARGLLLSLLVLGVALACLQPFLGIRLAAQSTFIPVMLALVLCFDVLSVALLVGQFRDTGDRRPLALCWAYVFSLVTLLGWAAAFPKVFGSPAPLGAVPSTAPWLWVAWHTGFPVLLAVALAPWPKALAGKVSQRRRGTLAWMTVSAMAGAGVLVVAGTVLLAERLPVIITGTDTSAMTSLAGPVILPVVALATVTTVVGAYRRGGAERWAGLAAAASLGDVVFTLFSHYRFSVGWYAGRTLTIVSAGVVLIALLAQFSGMKRRLAVERDRLRASLDRVQRLERLQDTLLEHMVDGVVMHSHTGELVASNPAAHRLLGLTAEQMHHRTRPRPGWRAIWPDGTPMDGSQTALEVTLATGAAQRDELMGVQTAEGSPRWLSINTAAVRHPSGELEYVVSSLTDVTDSQASALAASQERHVRRERVQQVLDGGGPAMVFQPIVELATGRTIGAEALARFPIHQNRAPDQWFRDAAEVGLGVELELSAIRVALSQLDLLPSGTYLSLNAGPATVVSPCLRDMLRAASPGRLVLELTEHIGVDDYSDLTEVLDELRALGVRLAVDDAGAGFASLQHILNLKPDIIKLDRALVEGIDADPARRALAGSLMAFATEIGAQVIAEGIETLREQTVLRRLGVRYGQGFHLGRPGPLPLAEQSTIPSARLFAVQGG